MLTRSAPAKINLSLRILGKRPDGFHHLDTRFLAIDLCDELHFSSAPAFSLTCSDSSVPVDESNLVTRALRAMEQHLHRPLPYHIHLEKRIPHGAGLGGGSSDAATTLDALNQLEGTPLSPTELHAIAAQLGSDVPFFLLGGIADASGRGELLTPRPDLSWTAPLLLLKPSFGVPTPDAYRRWANSQEIPGISYAPQEVDQHLLVNDLERPVFDKFRFLPEVKLWLQQQEETRAALMSGSGSTVFAVLKDLNDAPALIARARQSLDPTLWAWQGHALAAS